VFFVPLAPVLDPGLVPSSIAQALGLRDISGRDLMERITSHLEGLSALLVLDNFEHLLDAATVVGQLIGETEAPRVVVTSRAPLRLAGEQECPVPPLVDDEAVRLFCERSAAVAPDFALDAGNAAAVEAIVERLDRLPLAVELAAARSKLLSPEAILERLEDALGFLVGGARDAPDRQRTLRATIAWSYDLLGADARRLLAAWPIFRGGAELATLEVVCARAFGHEFPVLEAIEELVDLNLLRPAPGGGMARFMMLETIREFANTKLAELPEAEPVRAAHASAFAQLGQEAEPQLFGPREKEWLDRLDLEQHNLRLALDRLLDTSPADALRMAVALFWFWSVRGHFQEGRARLAECLARAPAETPIRAAALAAASWLAIDVGAYEDALAQSTAAVEIAGRFGDAAAEGRALTFMVRAWLSQLRPDRAAELGAGAVAKLRETADRAGLAWALLYEGLAAEFGARPAAAVPLFEESITITDELGWRSIGARGRINLGFALVDLGKLAEARDGLGRGLPVAVEMGDRYVAPIALGAFGAIAARTGRPRLALRLLGAAEAVADAGQFAIPAPVAVVFERWFASPRREVGAGARRHEAEGRQLSLAEAVALALVDGPDEPLIPEPAGGLSRREREVAELVARGLTNRQAAERLHLSVRTVDVHVDHVLTKLGFHSRTELAGWAHQQGLLEPKST
jgi:non-specific serine/threonine protein kinase